ncbi:MAG: DnaJ domain-containing protein [Nitrospira sp.]|nr:DnaJ domain-containing protein [Nitrospira sp.]
MERVQPDYYAILEVTPQASNKEIKRAYRRKVKKYHPDLNKQNNHAERIVREINAAYEILSNPEERKKYDSARIDYDAAVRQTDKRPAAAAEPPDSQGRYDEWRSHTSEEPALKSGNGLLTVFQLIINPWLILFYFLDGKISDRLIFFIILLCSFLVVWLAQ